MASTTRNPSIKRLEKEIIKESKAEEDAVKEGLNDLSRLEKDLRKAQKSAGKADSILDKRDKYEHKTAKRMNEAIHSHDIAVMNLHAAEKDSKLKHDHQVRLAKALEMKKVAIEGAIQGQEEHDKIRETKLAQMRGVSVPPPPPPPRSNPVGQNEPVVENIGHAAGYGVHFNRTNVDSEGNPKGVN